MGTSNKTERQTRIKLLRQQEDRNKRLPELLSHLSSIAGRQFLDKDTLTIDEIEKHSISLNSSDFDFNFLNISFPQNKRIELVNKLKILSSQLDQTNYLTFYQWAEIAVLKTNTSFITDSVEQLIELDKRRFYVHDSAYLNGLWVSSCRDYWFLDGSAKLIDILELRIFGKEWIKQIASVM